MEALCSDTSRYLRVCVNPKAHHWDLYSMSPRPRKRSPRSRPTLAAHARGPRSRPTLAAHGGSPRSWPTEAAHARSPRSQPTLASIKQECQASISSTCPVRHGPCTDQILLVLGGRVIPSVCPTPAPDLRGTQAHTRDRVNPGARRRRSHHGTRTSRSPLAHRLHRLHRLERQESVLQ
jgi:hypothetical protein